MQPNESPLTRVESLALQFYADGTPIKCIAYEMAEKYWKIRKHLANAQKKVGAKNLTHLATEAVRRGWVE